MCFLQILNMILLSLDLDRVVQLWHPDCLRCHIGKCCSLRLVSFIYSSSIIITLLFTPFKSYTRFYISGKFSKLLTIISLPNLIILWTHFRFLILWKRFHMNILPIKLAARCMWMWCIPALQMSRHS